MILKAPSSLRHSLTLAQRCSRFPSHLSCRSVLMKHWGWKSAVCGIHSITDRAKIFAFLTWHEAVFLRSFYRGLCQVSVSRCAAGIPALLAARHQGSLLAATSRCPEARGDNRAMRLLLTCRHLFHHFKLFPDQRILNNLFILKLFYIQIIPSSDLPKSRFCWGYNSIAVSIINAWEIICWIVHTLIRPHSDTINLFWVEGIMNYGNWVSPSFSEWKISWMQVGVILP